VNGLGRGIGEAIPKTPPQANLAVGFGVTARCLNFPGSLVNGNGRFEPLMLDLCPEREQIGLQGGDDPRRELAVGIDPGDEPVSLCRYRVALGAQAAVLRNERSEFGKQCPAIDREETFCWGAGLVVCRRWVCIQIYFRHGVSIMQNRDTCKGARLRSRESAASAGYATNERRRGARSP
jgi:hypothetical protein